MALFRTVPGVARSLPTQRADLAFGLASEEDSLETLQSFLGTTLRRNGGYSVMDFQNPDRTVSCELKTRRIRHDQFPTLLIGANKIHYADTHPGEHWFAFCCLDGLYVIQYNRDLFSTFETDDNYYRGERPDCENKAQAVYYIPVEHLSLVRPT